MARLEKAMKDFIECEELINNADKIEQTLRNKHQELLSQEINFDIDGAEAIYQSYRQILTNREDVEKCHEMKTKATEVIKEYLEATGGKHIVYSYPKGLVYPRYAFHLNEKGEVVHNN